MSTQSAARGFPAALLQRLTGSAVVAVLTGAGISAESGIPTFRGADGLWNKLKPEELASMDAFLKNTARVWEWYAHRKQIMAEIGPNAGHRALVEMEQLVSRVVVITQNIDNLHQRAGTRVVHELHGNIERNYCMDCGRQYRNEGLFDGGPVPRCACGGIIRPDVVWFGEMLPEDAWQAAVRAAGTADVFFSVGTSAAVYPAASLPFIAQEAGAFLVEVNPEPTPLTHRADAFLQGPAGEVLPTLVNAVRALRAAPPTSTP